MYRSKDVSTTPQIHGSSKLSCYQDSILDITEKPKLEANNMIEKTFSAFKECEDSIYDLAMDRLVMQCIQDTVTNVDKTLSQEIVKKLKSILLHFNLTKYMRISLAAENSPGQLLGIKDIPDAELTQVEKLELKNYIETRLRERITKLLEMYEKEGYSIEEGIKSAESGARQRFMKKIGLEQIHWQKKIEEALQKYEDNLVSCCEQMSRWQELKEQKSYCQVQKAAHLEIHARIAELKAKIGKTICITKMFTETPFTIDAYKTLNAMLDNKLTNFDKEIHEKMELKKQYDALKGTEFDDIVKQYKELCIAVDKNKKFLERL